MVEIKIHGDCIEEMDKLMSEWEGKVDGCISDIPYNTGIQASDGGRFDDFFDDKFTDYGFEELIKGMANRVNKLLKEDAWTFIWIDWRNVCWVRRIFEKHFKLRSMIVWDKVDFGLGRVFRFQHELCLVFSKGNPELPDHNKAKRFQSDIWQVRRPNPNDLKHPTEKPVELYDAILKMFGHRGEVWIDPFAGSGPIITACRNNGMGYIVIEKEEKYVKLWDTYRGNRSLFDF